MNFISVILLCLIITGIKSNKFQKVIDYAKKQVGSGYCVGTSGQKMTERYLQYLITRYGKERVNPDFQREKNMGKIVFDSVGLVVKAFNEVGIKISTSSTWKGTTWIRKGKIAELGKDKLAILFKGDGTKMEHIGIYITEGRFIHAKGLNDGVVEESLSSYPWTHFGIPKGLFGS